MEQMKSLKKNSFYSFLNAFSTLIFPLITFPYASRILHPEGIGQVNFAVSIESYFSMLAGLGMGAYATREASKIRDNKYELSKFCKEMLAISFISMIISYSLLFGCVFFIPKLYSYRILILVRSMNIFFTTIGIEWLYRAEEDFKYITLRSLFFKISGLAFLFIFVKNQTDTVAYTLFGILTSVASNICNLFHSRKFISYTQKCKLELKKHIKYLFTFFGIGLVTSLYTILDTSMLGFLSNDTQVGFYSAATRINKLVVGVLSATASVLLPRMTYYKEHDEIEKIKALSQKSISIMILLALPMAIGLIFLAKPLIYIFSGELFLDATIAMNIISPIILTIGIATITGSQLLPSLGKEKASLISYSVGAALNITMNTIFIPKMGATGAAIGTLVAESSITIVQLYFARKYLNIKILKTVLQSVICCIPMTSILFMISLFIKKPILNVIISVITSIPVYALFLAIQKNEYYMEIKQLIMLKMKKS